MPYHQNGTACLPQDPGLLSHHYYNSYSPYFPFGWPFHPERNVFFPGILLCFFFILRWFLTWERMTPPFFYLAVDCGISGDWGFSGKHPSSLLPTRRSSMSIFTSAFLHFAFLHSTEGSCQPSQEIIHVNLHCPTLGNHRWQASHIVTDLIAS